MSVVAHFFGGPWDGRMQALENAPYRLVVPVLPPITLLAAGPSEEYLPYVEMHYVRRGPVLAGHAYYDIDRATEPTSR